MFCSAQIKSERLQAANSASRPQLIYAYCTVTEMALNSRDVWGHFAPMFHLVDAFAIYAITLVGGRHAILPTFTAQEALLTIGEQLLQHGCCLALLLTSLICIPSQPNVLVLHIGNMVKHFPSIVHADPLLACI